MEMILINHDFLIEIKIESTRIRIKYLLLESWEKLISILCKVSYKNHCFCIMVLSYNTISILFIGFLSTRDAYLTHLSSSPCIRWTNLWTLCTKKNTETRLIRPKTEKNSARSSYKVCRKKLPRYMLAVFSFLREESSHRAKEVINDEFHSV